MTVRIKETPEGFITPRNSEWNNNKSRIIVLSEEEYNEISICAVEQVKDKINEILNGKK